MVAPTRHSRATWAVLAVGLAGLLAGSALANGPAPKYAIRAGKVVTITGGAIDNGVVLVSDGKIEAVGRAGEIAVPDGYAVIDAPRSWLMPGMVEVHSHSGVQGGLNDMVCQVNPGMLIGDGVDPDDADMDLCLAAGITTIQTIPGSGTNHGGFGVAFKTAGETKEDRLVRRVSIMKLTQAYNPERGGGDIGQSRMGMAWILRQHMDRARTYNDAWNAYESGQSASPPPRDLALEAVRAALNGGIPVLIHTYESWGVLMSMAMFREEYGLKCIATHAGFGAWTAAETVARPGYSINIGPNVQDFYRGGDAAFRGEVPTFAQGGVTGLTVNTDSFGLGQALLADKAAMASRLGLDERQALEMVTINAARAMLLDDRLGSIEVGKDADLVIKGSTMLDPTTPIEMVFVNGRLAYRNGTEGGPHE
jgi:imidazolonepropionase-like amidohydrolase